MTPPTLAIIAEPKKLPVLIDKLSGRGFDLLLCSNNEIGGRASLALICLEHDNAQPHLTLPWLAWDLTDNTQATSNAYKAGARAVFPKETPIDVIVDAIRRIMGELLQNGATPKPRRQRTYRRGELILLEADAVLHVEQGVLATTMIHHDGAEVLLGLSGKGQILVAHPDDNCHIQIVAHTDASVHIEPWNSAVQHPDFTAKLRARLQQMEGWAAMQARPSLQQRILGLLGLLAEQFGKPCETGVLIEVRITHSQLAAAVGATRTSITRVLSELRAQDRISTVTRDGDDLLCLTEISGRHYHY